MSDNPYDLSEGNKGLRSLSQLKRIATQTGRPVSDAYLIHYRERAERAEAALVGIRAWLEQQSAKDLPTDRLIGYDEALAELDRLTTPQEREP